jgi:UDP-3-O-[3-hydroxymyristoyl] glucosamine N-acyltransferase
MRLKKIADYLGGELHGPEDLEIKAPAKIESAKKGEITFLSNPKYRQYLSATKASAVIVDSPISELKIPHIIVNNAYAGFVMLLKLYMTSSYDYFEGVSDKAYIDKSAKIDKTAKIAPLAYIGPKVKIGKNSVVFPGVIILKNVKIGNDCILYANVSVRENCIIGNRVILQNGCVIGSDGFGFAPEGDKYEKIPQLGNVIINDDVEIGANTTIDRATLGATIINEGTKLDNLVQIAHNVVIGEDTVVAAQTGISGSTEIGNHVTIGGQVGIVGHIKIDDHVMIAAQSGVSKDVAGKAVLFGSPALPIMQQKRIEVSLRHLPEMVKKMHQLENEIIALKEKLNEENT